MRSIHQIGTYALAIVLCVAACTRQASTDQNKEDLNLASYNAADPVGESAGARGAADQSDDQIAMNSWDLDGSAVPTPPGNERIAPTKVDVEDLHSAYRSNAVA